MKPILSERSENQQNVAKLSRQNGTANLLQKAFNVEKNANYDGQKAITPSEISSNGSFIQDLEMKLLEKKDCKESEEPRKLTFRMNHPNAKQIMDAVFQKTRQKEDISSIADEYPTAPPSVCSVYPNGENFFGSAMSTASSLRATFAHIDMKEDMKPLKPMYFDEFKDSDLATSYTQKQLSKEQRENSMMNSEEYMDDIYEYMCHRQTTIRASSLYLTKQPEVTAEMRAIMIDWFHDVGNEYNLSQQTFHLAVSLVDRVMSKFCVQKTRFQLIGVTCLMIAAKFEEIYPPDVKDFATVTDDAFTAEQVLHMEKYLLAQLDYVVSTPTFVWFASMFARRQKADKRTTHLAMYLVDVALHEAEMLQFRRQYVAGACLCYANILLGAAEPWSEDMETFSKIGMYSMNKIVLLLHRKYSSGTIEETHPSVYEKYMQLDMSEVSLVQPSLCDIEAVLGLKETRL